MKKVSDKLMNMTPLRIGFVTKSKINPEYLPEFTSVYTIYRKKANDIIKFRGEDYKKVNSDWDCYIRLSEYNQLFSLETGGSRD